MTSRKSKTPISRAIATEAITELLKQREGVMEQLNAIEEQEKYIRTKLGKLEEYIAFLRPITEGSAIGPLDKLPTHILTVIGDMLNTKSIVNLRATSRSMRNSLPLSANTQAEIHQKNSQHTRRVVAQNLDRRLDDIVQEAKAKRLSKQAQRKLDAESAAHSKQIESEVRKYTQLLLQPKIREQRAARQSAQK
jgi:hypothetical protein